MEGQEGLEPSTCCLRGSRSNQLSYWPALFLCLSDGPEDKSELKKYSNIPLFLQGCLRVRCPPAATWHSPPARLGQLARR